MAPAHAMISGDAIVTSLSYFWLSINECIAEDDGNDNYFMGADNYFMGASANLSRFVHLFEIWKLSVANSFDACHRILEAVLKSILFIFLDILFCILSPTDTH
jgi:hypothetical protein